MVILEKTPTLLKVQHRPYSLWFFTSSWAFGIPLLFLGLGMMQSWIFYLWWLPFFCAFFIISGMIVLILAGQVITCQFDKSKKRIILHERGMFKPQIQEYNLGEILDIQVTSKGWNPGNNNDYQLVIILRQGQSFNLSLGKQIPGENVNLIRNFVGLKSQCLQV